MKWKAYHSISALSHFYRNDFPRPFSDGTYYEEVVRNIFKDKNNPDVVEIELIYDIDINMQNSSSYSEIKIYAPKVDMKINEIIDVEQFVEWYGKRHGVEFKKNPKNNSYYYGDGYTRHAISIHEDEWFDFILIQLKIGRYDL